ncbi:MAG: hypothetical protein FIB01_16600 [Gemmatimonadetes bacterium]|nr:hypothetical protein [Gemmatimonadota bacterium]
MMVRSQPFWNVSCHSLYLAPPELLQSPPVAVTVMPSWKSCPGPSHHTRGGATHFTVCDPLGGEVMSASDRLRFTSILLPASLC